MTHTGVRGSEWNDLSFFRVKLELRIITGTRSPKVVAREPTPEKPGAKGGDVAGREK